MISVQELRKVNINKLNAMKMFDEFTNLQGNWFKLMPENIQNEYNQNDIKIVKFLKKTNSDVLSSVLLGAYQITEDITFYIYIIQKLFPNIFETHKIKISNGELLVFIEPYTIPDKFLIMGLVNLQSLFGFLLTYVKLFISQRKREHNSYFEFTLTAKCENPLSLLKMACFTKIRAQYDITDALRSFDNHTKPTDKYADEMALFMLFDELTTHCDANDAMQVVHPAPIYFLLFTDYEKSIIHFNNAGSVAYNFHIEVKDNDLYKNMISEMEKSDNLINIFKW